MVIDLLFGLILLFGFPGASLFVLVSNVLVIEFGAMLILGGCLMARQPLVDELRYDNAGKPTKAWRLAVQGRQILLSSIFVLLFALLFVLVENSLGV